MSMQDPVADMLTRIRNAQSRSKPDVTIRWSTLAVAMVRVLKEEGYIVDYVEGVDENKHHFLQVKLKYHQGRGVIRRIVRVSRPGLRIYERRDHLRRVMGGLGTAIMSTSKGVMTAVAAKKLGEGGEVLCTVE